MKSADHYSERATAALVQADQGEMDEGRWLMVAQVYATLAQAAATDELRIVMEANR